MNRTLALDLHGIINTYPVFFSTLTRSLLKDGWQIHVLTGSHIKEMKIEEELKSYGIEYTHIFSIADYHKNNQTKGMWHDEKGNPWVSDEDWDKTKAEYCKNNNIAFCIDDTARYADYFETPFGYMSIKMAKDKPNKYLNLIIEMFNKRSKEAKKTDKINGPYDTVWHKINTWFENKFGSFFCPAEKLGKEEQNKKYL